MATPAVDRVELPVDSFSWRTTLGMAARTTSEAALGTALPVAAAVGMFALSPESTEWLMQHGWWMWGGLGVAAATGVIGVREVAKNLYLITSTKKQLAKEALGAVALAGVTAVSFLGIVAGSVTESYGMLPATVAVAVGVGTSAAVALGVRIKFRSAEKATALMNQGIGSAWRKLDSEVKIAAENVSNRQAVEIWRQINDKIVTVDGAVSDSIEREIARLAMERAEGKVEDKKFDETVFRILKTAIARALYLKERGGLFIKPEGAGVVDNGASLELVVARREVTVEHLKEVLKLK